jgi:AcrR family transcriptional regulator
MKHSGLSSDARKGRINQKARTRAAIIQAAKQLQEEGATPTVEDTAARAQVSRATAYRYFPSQEALLVELGEVIPSVVRVDEMLTELDGDDVQERLLKLLDTFGRTVLKEEVHYRRALRVYQDTWLRNRRGATQAMPVVREGRRMRWLDKVLEPVEGLSDAQRRRLQAALALTLGIDSVAIMKDVCRLDDDQALAVLSWAAQAILRAGLEEGRGASTIPVHAGHSFAPPLS